MRVMISLTLRMKIKVLECPLWVQSDDNYNEEILHYSFDEIEPLFNRNGHYLINNKNVIIEYRGRAWKSKNQKGSVEAFYWELEDVVYDGINILSKTESDAIFTLMKVGLANKEQEYLYRKDYSNRKRKLENYQWRDA